MKLNYNNTKSFLRKDIYITRLIFLMIVWMIFMAIFKFDKFYTLINFQTMAAQFPEFGLMALGVMLCMITGGIDLSVVGVANLVAIVSGIILKQFITVNGELLTIAIPLVFLISIVLGALAGALNGFLVSVIRIPPILATLGSLELFRGIGIILTKGKAISGIPFEFSEAITHKLFGILPNQLLIFLVVVLLIAFLINNTAYGKKLYLTGTNITAAKFSGIRTKSVLIKTYMISSISAALAGLIMLANYNSARADYGTVYTLQCVLIVVLGGVNPAGGKGKVTGVVLAICVLQMLSSGLNRFPQISSFYIPLIWGGVLITVMVINYFTENSIKVFRGKIKKLIVNGEKL
ncbi:ABC transporter permease [Vallitalea okinawensis]|uniref:ABC transporter permease n=1 Tax=Vallitalea okinawensis TaxID=2078660 RepID=UPI000CFCC8A9|nr:ABC transporter permease [Vallitalea okinawensis]